VPCESRIYSAISFTINLKRRVQTGIDRAEVGPKTIVNFLEINIRESARGNVSHGPKRSGGTSFHDRWINEETGDSSEISFGFDFGAENAGKLAAKIYVSAGTADDDGTDNCRLPFVL
jgi:hypothetical protein